MSRREQRKMKKNTKKKVIIMLVAVLLVIILLALIPVVWYGTSVSPMDRNNEEIVRLEIPMGTDSRGIATMLRENGLIRNENAFRIYVWLRGETTFQAGTYEFHRSMSLSEIVTALEGGIFHDPNNIQITFLEGINLWRMAREIEQQTNNTQDDVWELLANEEYIQGLIDRFWFLTEEIQNPELFYPLEGYLFPDTYSFRNEDVTVEEIFEAMLRRMDEVLSAYREEIEASTFSVHEMLSFAAVLETEGNSKEAATIISSIIYNRLAVNMSLGMDPTAFYAVRVHPSERDLRVSELNRYSPFNTRGPNMEGRLPVGPIATVSRNSIQATLRPADTNYLFFVSDRYGRLYFRETMAGHYEIIRQLQAEGLWYMPGAGN
ncbi:MAG: endolytic transglycosylase MltG [Oscillospiraceae bacterium]|nr:endolytic transglycosylase MltG [Oscillospiraceae bacterium]